MFSIGAKYPPLGGEGDTDNKKTVSSAQEARCRVRIQDPLVHSWVAPVAAHLARNNVRPPGLRKSDTPPRGTSGCALPYSSIFRPVPIPLNNRQPPPRAGPVCCASICKRRNSLAVDYIDWYCCIRRQFESARPVAIAVSPKRSLEPISD